MASPKVFKYRTIWEKIKKDDKCIVAVTPAFEARVRKAVIKEKNKDTVFKFNNDIDKRVLRITYNKVDQHLIFELKARYGIMEKKL